MNEFGLGDNSCRCYEQLMARDDINDLGSGAQGYKCY